MTIPKTFKAFVVDVNAHNVSRSIQDKAIETLPEFDDALLIHVQYSSLNYKDALSASGNKGVTKNYPHTPGIDAVGTVVDSKSDAFSEGDSVIVTSYDLGMNTAGGFAEYIRVPATWAVRLPEGMSAKEAMIIGTAGLTAGISVLRLIEWVKQDAGNIVVSGATGGVGSLSVAILTQLGYSVTAISGKTEAKDFLEQLGVKDIISRDEIDKTNHRPMLKSQFAGGIDTTGGPILENIIKATQAMGVVTCCGNVASPKLELTVFPFILRGVSLIGIDSQHYPMPYRESIWRKLAQEWKPSALMSMYTEITLDELEDNIELILKGQLKGRTVLRLRA